jgi:hypothetical protein
MPVLSGRSRGLALVEPGQLLVRVGSRARARGRHAPAGVWSRARRFLAATAAQTPLGAQLLLAGAPALPLLGLQGALGRVRDGRAQREGDDARERRRQLKGRQMPGTNAGTGCPNWFRCSRCRMTGGKYDYVLTGKWWPLFHSGPRMAPARVEYKCGCGHIGESRHIDIVRRAVDEGVIPSGKVSHRGKLLVAR